MLNNGSVSTLKDFDTLGKLGQGSFGVVYKVKRRIDNNVYVMKQINISKMNTRMKQDAINEVNILSKLNNPYVVKYYDSFIDKNLLCIVMEYCDSGDLSTFLKSQLGRPLQELKIWKFFILSCLGLDYIHRKKILHRDIKAMNIFLTKDDSLRIGDLGVAKVLSEQNNFAHTMVGTPFYLSPEMCEEKPYNEKSDVWSLGCVLYELCTYRHPFEANNQGALVLRIIRGKYNPIASTYSKELVQMVDMCLCRDYKKRPNAREILQSQLVTQKASQLSIELDCTKIKNKEIAYHQKKNEISSAPSVTETPQQNKNQLDKQRDKNNAFLNVNNPAVKIISKSPSTQNVQAPQAKLKDDVLKKMQQDEKELNKKAEQKLNQQLIQNMQKDEKKYKDKVQELYKKEEVLKPQQKQELEKQKQTEQILNMQKKREEIIKKEEERKQLEKKRKEEIAKRDAEQKKEDEELRKKKELEKQKQDQAQLQLQQQIKQKEDQYKNDFKIKQNGFDIRQQNQISQQKLEKSSPKNTENKKQLFGNQQVDNLNEKFQPKVNLNQPNYGIPKQKKEPIVEKKELEKQKEIERQNVQRIRKNSPNQLGNNAKNPQSNQMKDVRQSKDSDMYNDRNEVLNLPDNVHNKRNAPKSASNNKPTVNDLRNIASVRDNQKKVNKPEQGKLPSVESFDSSFESVEKEKNIHSEQGLNKWSQDEKDMNKAIQDNDHHRAKSLKEKEKLHYNQPFVSKDITDKHKQQIAKQNIIKQYMNYQQVVDDNFIDNEFASSSDEDNARNSKQNKVDNNDKYKKEMMKPSENTQFEFIPIPKPNQVQQNNKTQQKPNTSNKQQDSESFDDENDNKLGDEYLKSQTINRNQLDLPEDVDFDDEDNEESKYQNENEDQEEDEYYDDEHNDDEEEGNDDEIKSIPDQNEWQQDEDDDNKDIDEDEDQQEQSTQDDIQNQNFSEKKRKDLELKMQAQIKRQNELQTLFNIKVQECHKVLGEAKFNMILSFFKDKLNSEQELTDKDQDEIDQMIQDNMKNIPNMQVKYFRNRQIQFVIHNFYKILHLEVELEKCKVNIKNLEQNIKNI